jgi:hypothetical protein
VIEKWGPPIPVILSKAKDLCSLPDSEELHRSLRQAQGRLFAARNAVQDDNAFLYEAFLYELFSPFAACRHWRNADPQITISSLDPEA